MSLYRVTGTQTVTSKTILTIVGSATAQPKIVSYIASNVGAITVDSQWQLQLKLTTTTGTPGSSPTPRPTNPNDIATPTGWTAGTGFGAEPTYAAGQPLDDVGLNPRQAYRWWAYEQADELIVPSVANNGIGFFLNALGGAVNPQVVASVRT